MAAPVRLELTWEGPSREKYCSVWHTLRPDLALHISFEVRPPARR